MRLSEIQMRDPFVLPVAEERAYYLFGSTDPNIWSGPGTGFDCYRSRDLVEWDGPIPAFRPPPDFWAPGCFWAPEVHRHHQAWFMFATFTAADGRRGTQVLRATAPDGPYTPWSDGALTPSDWLCLDGTLHVDDSGPWLVFCHEWAQCGDGEVCASRLTDDLRATIGKPSLLFRASDAPWVRPFEGVEQLGLVTAPPPFYVTDGPFLHRTHHGDLLMLWSSFGADGYAMGIARSMSGSLRGPWRHEPQPIWDRDGGHGMLFHTFDGQLHLTLHTPNRTPDERAVFVPVDETTDGLAVRPR
jgi:hypothetical protein